MQVKEGVIVDLKLSPSGHVTEVLKNLRYVDVDDGSYEIITRKSPVGNAIYGKEKGDKVKEFNSGMEIEILDVREGS